MFTINWNWCSRSAGTRTFTREEARRCLHAAATLRQLRRFKEHFVDARTHGARAQESEHRAMYVIFAYTTDLRAEAVVEDASVYGKSGWERWGTLRCVIALGQSEP